MTQTTRCHDCGCPITWAAQRKQYGRLMRLGFTPDQATVGMPRCQKCVTKWLKTSHLAGPSATFRLPGGREYI